LLFLGRSLVGWVGLGAFHLEAVMGGVTCLSCSVFFTEIQISFADFVFGLPGIASFLELFQQFFVFLSKSVYPRESFMLFI
jgi:hypothetical protein